MENENCISLFVQGQKITIYVGQVIGEYSIVAISKELKLVSLIENGANERENMHH